MEVPYELINHCRSFNIMMIMRIALTILTFGFFLSWDFILFRIFWNL